MKFDVEEEVKRRKEEEEEEKENNQLASLWSGVLEAVYHCRYHAHRGGEYYYEYHCSQFENNVYDCYHYYYYYYHYYSYYDPCRRQYRPLFHLVCLLLFLRLFLLFFVVVFHLLSAFP